MKTHRGCHSRGQFEADQPDANNAWWMSFIVFASSPLPIFIIAVIIKRNARRPANTAEDVANDDATIMTSRRRHDYDVTATSNYRAVRAALYVALITRRRIWITRSAATSISRRNMLDYTMTLNASGAASRRLAYGYPASTETGPCFRAGMKRFDLFKTCSTPSRPTNRRLKSILIIFIFIHHALIEKKENKISQNKLN